MLVRRAEDVVDDVRREVVRDHDLHEEPGADEEERARRVDVAGVARRVELRDQLAGPHDRAGDEVREEREVRGERPEPDRREVAAVDVHDVADRHEREEGDADGEEDRARLERHVDPDEREEVVRRRDEEVVVLEVPEQAEVPGEREPRGAAFARAGRAGRGSRARTPGSRRSRTRAGSRTASPSRRRRRSSPR